MSWGAIAGTVVSTVGGAIAAKKQAKAAKAAAKAAEKAQVDPEKISQIARDQAAKNVEASLALERKYAPDQQSFRDESLAGLLTKMRQGSPYSDLATSSVAGQLSAPDLTAARSQLLTDAINKASQNLALGGALDTATRNEVTRRAASTAGRVGGGNLGLGGTVTARDLGLTSLDLANQRLASAGQFGQIEQGLNQADLQGALQQRLYRTNLATTLQGMEGNNLSRYAALASFGQGLQSPEAGLSPGDLASLYTQNASNAATAGQNAAALQAQTGRNTGQLFGMVGGQIADTNWGKVGTGLKNWWGGLGGSNITGIQNPNGNSNSGGVY